MANSSKENSPSNNPQHNTTNEQIESSSSSSSSSSPSRTPLRAIPSGPGGSSRGDHQGNKKADEIVQIQQGSSSTSVPKRKRRELDAPKSEPKCSECGKKFASWKAVFGHLRAHPDRAYRGAFPPPKGDAAAWIPRNLPPEQILASTLLRLASETLAKMRQEQSDGGGSSRVFNFDLNEEPAPEESVDLSGPPQPSPLPPPPPPPLQGGLDLNLPPSQENEDEELDGHDHNQ